MINNKITAIDKAAILLMSLPAQESAAIMKLLEHRHVQSIGVSMANIHDIEKETRNDILVNFAQELEHTTSLGLKSEKFIEQVMTEALGPEKAPILLDKIMMDKDNKGVEALQWMDINAIYEMIAEEHPQFQCIVLSYLEPEQAAQVLTLFVETARVDLILRLAKLDSLSGHALQEVNEMLEKQFQQVPKESDKIVGGVKVVADIINSLDKDIETQLIEKINECNPELSQLIEDNMFVFDNFINVDDRGIQAILKEVSNDNLIVALKGVDDTLRDKILNNMSKRAADMLKDDLEAKGPVKITEVEAAQKEIIASAKRLAEANEISLGGKSGEEMI